MNPIAKAGATKKLLSIAAVAACLCLAGCASAEDRPDPSNWEYECRAGVTDCWPYGGSDYDTGLEPPLDDPYCLENVGSCADDWRVED